ncbi:MAG: potassium channel family protein [Candidatus Xenobia bacterium]
MAWAVVGVLLIGMTLQDLFEVVILPRRIVRRLRPATFILRTSWRFWSWLAELSHNPKRKESLLAWFGPLSLLMLLVAWVLGCLVGFALILWGLQTPITGGASFLDCLYLSGVTFFTLGYGDLVPTGSLGRLVCVVEVGTGLGLLAIVIGYLPVVYQGFSRREVAISLLDARAGSPPTAERLLLRHAHHLNELEQLLRDWERWAAEVLESHLSYPTLGIFRSQHSNQSWLAALTIMLDTCAMVLAVLEDGPAWQARLTFAMTRHALVDLAQVYDVKRLGDDSDRLPDEAAQALLARLAAGGLVIKPQVEVTRLRRLREMYEPYAFALAQRLHLRMPEWIVPAQAIENWQTSPWERLTDVAMRALDPHD